MAGRRGQGEGGRGDARSYPEAKLSWPLRMRLLASMSTGRFPHRLGSSDFSDKRDFQLPRLADLGPRLESFVHYPFHVFKHAATVGFPAQVRRVVGCIMPHRHPSIRVASNPKTSCRGAASHGSRQPPTNRRERRVQASTVAMSSVRTPGVPPARKPRATPCPRARLDGGGSMKMMSMVPDQALARIVVEEGIRQYFAARRERVEPFVDRHFSLRGSLRLHRAALGWDLGRAPLNLVLAGPQFGLHAVGRAAKRAGATRLAASMESRNITLRTRVARDIEWAIATELLELPWRQDDRVATRDALAETILAEPRLTEALHPVLAAIGERAAEPAYRQRLQETLGRYAGTRDAAAEITTSLLTLGAGAIALKQLTPGVVTLGPALAGMLAQQVAIASFPLGAGLGGVLV